MIRAYPPSIRAAHRAAVATCLEIIWKGIAMNCHSIARSLVTVCLAFAGSAGARDFRCADVHRNDYPTIEAVRQMGKALKMGYAH